MKQLKIFPTLNEYRNFIYNEIIANDEFKKYPFYRGLIDFVIDHRTPLFFQPTRDYEHAHFTQYFNYVLMRQDYTNQYLRDLYFLHDFVHMIFDNPLRPRDYSLKRFREIVVSNERVAANETEIFTYYRLPGLRSKTLNQPILYDFIKTHHTKKPTIMAIYDLRNKLIETDFIPEYLDDDAGRVVVAFLKRFKENNKTWSKLWREEFPAKAAGAFEKPMTLSLATYEKVLENYQPINSQELYERNMLFNIRLGLRMLGYKKLPETFKSALKLTTVFENKVLMEKAATRYHRLYSKSKNKASRQSRPRLDRISSRNSESNSNKSMPSMWSY